jgi:8-oxo-dGTP pyrophosphatase MutT (NUDIX family)
MPRESAGGIIVNSEGKIVLVEQNHNSWSFPKGKLEAGETELQAATREIAEETGIIDLVLLNKLGSYERYSIAKDGVSEQIETGVRKRTLFLFKTNQNELTPHDDEVTNAKFVTLEEALALLTHPKDKEFLESVREKVESALQ